MSDQQATFIVLWIKRLNIVLEISLYSTDTQMHEIRSALQTQGVRAVVNALLIIWTARERVLQNIFLSWLVFDPKIELGEECKPSRHSLR